MIGFFALLILLLLSFLLFTLVLSTFSNVHSPIADWLNLNSISLLLDVLANFTLESLPEEISSNTYTWLSLQLISVTCFYDGDCTIDFVVSIFDVMIDGSLSMSYACERVLSCTAPESCVLDETYAYLVTFSTPIVFPFTILLFFTVFLLSFLLLLIAFSPYLSPIIYFSCLLTSF